jgi:hypothetical protein
VWLKDTSESAAGRVVRHTRQLVEEHLSRFNSTSGANPVSVDGFITQFVERLVMDNTSGTPVPRPQRTIATALYTFIAEFEERYKELKLRSKNGGSAELPLNYLFKGGLIFESILKTCYPAHRNATMRNVFSDPSFGKDFPGKICTSAKQISDILALARARPNARATAFDVTSQLRNTTGHNLIWDDAFADPENFRLLCEQQVGAVLHLVLKKFL